jgi:hypothetical protein
MSTMTEYLKALDKVNGNWLAWDTLEGPDKNIGVQFRKTCDGGLRSRFTYVILAKEELQGRHVRCR